MIISIQIVAPLILMAAILSCWSGRVWLTALLVVSTLATGFYTDVLNLMALPVLAGLWLSGWGLAYGRNLPARLISGTVFIGLSIALVHHIFSGFNNVLIWDQQVVKTGSAPFTLYYNIDKPWIGLVLLTTSVPLLKTSRQWAASLGKSVAPIAIMLSTIFAAGLLSGFVRWQPEWPQLGIWFLLNNLIFTAVAEEAFFRGFIQRHVSEYLVARSLNPFIGIVFASLLFGAAHYAGGIVYVGLASLAGFFYGWVYHRSGSIEMAVLSHWLLNASHFVLFSYPFAA